MLRMVVGLFLALILVGTPALAKDGSSKTKAESELVDILIHRDMDKETRFVINNTLFTIYHEVGHLLVDQLDWPVLSREEDVADNFATYILLNQSRRAIETALKDSALGWRLEDEIYGGARRQVSDYYDEHSLDLQRAYQIVCLMVGKDRGTFHATAREWGIDRARESRCADDYAQIAHSFQKLIDPHARKTVPIQVDVNYGYAEDEFELAYKTLRQSRLLESLAEDLREGYGLTRRIEINAQQCGEPNAFYDENEVQIIVCYELLDDFFYMINKHLAAANDN
ncbi:MAG: hypothetical protein KDJ19_14000 [Hyphomicrobiaceae bacterium]|nr:hypothetical protein [Hyphomicrobiaceae bacterium]MCC0024694.1 hypothetical protein [Hyphomicrobiaceae bacterium]